MADAPKVPPRKIADLLPYEGWRNSATADKARDWESRNPGEYGRLPRPGELMHAKGGKVQKVLRYSKGGKVISSKTY
jgi:hypothetical protein